MSVLPCHQCYSLFVISKPVFDLQIILCQPEDFKYVSVSSLYRLKSKFAFDDRSTNPGYVLSPVISHREVWGDSSSSVKVSIEILDSQQPVTFTCDGKISIYKLFCYLQASKVPCFKTLFQLTFVYLWYCQHTRNIIV